ncbi:hypothetical protein [Plantactinospora sp. KBS50]|uniref:MutS-related protein n=1 Tax=Plantactinospora sp. KBS50 TaxID=2024580 RepID=UPI000BAAD9B9|nr:hypothetical protein [Plantactinospora sp. KBS50]ASW56860.1 hypothetical protein CIK06_25915 [Plantactinospora sp. KBS50]
MTEPAFRSILFDDPADRDGVDERPVPDYFGDLNLDQVTAAVTRGRDSYRLAPFFHTPLRRVEAVAYRHEVFRELRRPEVRGAVAGFADRMRTVRDRLGQARRARYAPQRQLWFLDAADGYSAAVARLSEELDGLPLRSRGLCGLRRFLRSHVADQPFAERAVEAAGLRDRVAAVRYTIDIQGDRIRVGRYAGEPDYSGEIADTFARFRPGEARRRRSARQDLTEMNHVEAVVLQYVTELHPEVFGDVREFCARHDDFLDPVVTDFDREVQFYLAWLDYLDFLGEHGLRCCLPEVSATSRRTEVRQSFDVALADRLGRDSRPVIPNDVELHGDERILVISGPNQGGKTTYARMVGQLHHLARLGCPVPGSRARLFLADGIFTHFEREEVATDLHGRLEDDLLRVRHILDRATADSVVIMNEIFTSTTLEDALLLGGKIMDRLIRLGCLGVYVTFVDELSRLGPATVSLVSTVEAADAARRTFKVVRRAADGLSYALSLAQKYGLTYESLTERIR